MYDPHDLNVTWLCCVVWWVCWLRIVYSVSLSNTAEAECLLNRNFTLLGILSTWMVLQHMAGPQYLYISKYVKWKNWFTLQWNISVNLIYSCSRKANMKDNRKTAVRGKYFLILCNLGHWNKFLLLCVSSITIQLPYFSRGSGSLFGGRGF